MKPGELLLIWFGCFLAALAFIVMLPVLVFAVIWKATLNWYQDSECRHWRKLNE